MSDEAEIDRLRKALAEIRDLVQRRQLPITHQVYEIADAALYGPTATEEEGHNWVDNDKGGQDNLSA